MSLLTHFGAIALLTPFALVIALWLWRAVGRAAALWWCLCVTGVGLAVALAKVYLAACAPAWIALRSPSGHAAFATIAYGGYTVIALAGRRSARAWTFRAAIAAWVLLIGVSRVVVHAHTPGEVVAGLIAGALGLAVFAWRYQGRRRPPYRWAAALLLLVGVVALATPTPHFTIEPWLRLAAGWLQPLLCRP